MRKRHRPVSGGHPRRRWHILLPLLAPVLILSLVLAAKSWSLLSYRNLPDSASRQLPRLAYFVSGARGEGARIQRLLEAVYHPRNFYVVHVASSPEERADLVKHSAAQGNVRVMADRKVSEKGPTVLALTLHAVAILLKEFERWDWFVNLDTEDYPLMSQDDIIHIFSYLPRDLNFIEHTSKMEWKEIERVRPIMVDSGLYDSNKTSIFWAKEKRSVPSSFKLFFGSPGVVLTRAFLEFCIWGWDNLPRTLLLYYTNFLSSSESYFQTVICNSQEFQNTTVNDGLRFMLWDTPPQQYPVPLGIDHFKLMVDSGSPFAHRFIKPEDVLLDRIDRELVRRVKFGSPLSSAIRPGESSVRLERFLVQLLGPKRFRAHQCQ